MELQLKEHRSHIPNTIWEDLASDRQENGMFEDLEGFLESLSFEIDTNKATELQNGDKKQLDEAEVVQAMVPEPVKQPKPRSWASLFKGRDCRVSKHRKSRTVSTMLPRFSQSSLRPVQNTPRTQ